MILGQSICERKIAVIGNASGKIAHHGVIDNYDVVVRINHGFVLPVFKTSRGSKTDIVVTSSDDFLDKALTCGYKVVWLTTKNRDQVSKKWGEEIDFFSKVWWDDLFQRIGARPSSGIMAIEYLIKNKSKMDSIDLYGFSFYKTPSWYGGHQGVNCPHDFSREEYIIRGYEEKGLLSISPMLSDTERVILSPKLVTWRIRKNMHNAYSKIKSLF